MAMNPTVHLAALQAYLRIISFPGKLLPSLWFSRSGSAVALQRFNRGVSAVQPWRFSGSAAVACFTLIR
jgi:hypothetical protein